MRFAAHLPERGGINERDMARDEFAERGFGTVGGKSAQKLSVIGHFSYNTAAERRNRTGKSFDTVETALNSLY
jgi:hypothetical protein